MEKIKLIIAREYVAKLKSRTFILLTILGPLLYIGLIAGSALLTKSSRDSEKTILISDESGKYLNAFSSLEFLTIQPSNLTEAEIERAFEEEELAVPALFIPEDIMEGKEARLYYSENPGMGVIDRIQNVLNNQIREYKMRESGIDPDLVRKLEDSGIELSSINMSKEGAAGSAEAASAVSFISAFLLYFFIFLYGSMVLRGVQEEKTSRIAEVLISTVKPFELMMGKIIGNALVGITQFLIWVGLVVLGTVLFSTLGGGAEPQVGMQAGAEAQEKAMELLPMILNQLSALPIGQIVLFFFVYFIGGYLLYSSIFAAIAAAVDGQQDLQQFMFPVIIPLILAFVIMPSVIENPNNTIAIVFSIIPFTSPIVMMARIPFGVPWYELMLSVVLLTATFILMVYLAGKIYRIGLLSYNAKPSWRQLFKWLTYKQ